MTPGKFSVISYSFTQGRQYTSQSILGDKRCIYNSQLRVIYSHHTSHPLEEETRLFLLVEILKVISVFSSYPMFRITTHGEGLIPILYLQGPNMLPDNPVILFQELVPCIWNLPPH